MMVLKGRSGKVYQTEQNQLGKGGEGAVYRIIGQPDLVVKIYNDKGRSESQHRKLLTMINTSISDTAMKSVAWPIDVVYDNGSFVGYVMPLVKQFEPLNVMYSDKYICTLTEKIAIAKNLCAAVNAVHNVGQVCGDLNPNNICVDPNSTLITLVDTDSYHITDPSTNRIYRCGVGLPEYLSKELQNELYKHRDKDLRTLSLPTFTKETDLFALAVHIFALLMNGCHPFACAKDNTENIGHLSISQPSVALPQPIDNIRDGFFPFYEKRSGITIPKYAPPFSVLPKNIQNLFVRAFVDGSNNPKLRPDTEEWYAALDDMKSHLKVCKKDKSHEFSDHLKVCPWCDIENNYNSFIVQQTALQQMPLKTPVQTSKPSNQQTYNKTATTGNNIHSSNVNIKRSSWPMWLLFIVTGCVTGPLMAFLVIIPYIMPLVYDFVDFQIPDIVLYIAMFIIGGATGAIISHFAQDSYETSEKGGPWLLLSLCVPIAAIVATILLLIIIGLVVGIVYIALVILVLVVGGAIAAACCGG